MKKIWIGVAAVLVLAVGAVLFMQGRKGGPAATAEVAAYVPQNVLALSYLDNLNARIDTFGTSPLGQLLSKETVRAILTEMQAKPEEIQAYEQWHDSMSSVLTNPLFRSTFGDDLTLAFLAPDAQLLKENPQQAINNSLLAYATTNIAATAELFGKLAKGVKIEKERVGNLELTRIEFDGGKHVVYGYDAKGVVLLALSKDAISAAMQAKENGNSLQNAPGYQEASAFWQKMASADTYGRSYVNTPAWVALFQQATQDEEVKEVLTYLQGLDYSYSVSDVTPKGLYSKGRLKLHYEQLHPLFKDMVDEAEANPAPVPLSLISDKALFFEWGRSLKLEKIFESIAAKDPQLSDSTIQEQIKSTLGMSLQEALASFGPVYGLVLNDVVETGVFPVPDMTFFASVRNRERINTLATLANQQISNSYGLIGKQQQLADNSQLYSWPMMTEVGLIPTLGFNDAFVFVGSMENSLQTLLAASAGKGDSALPPALAERLGPDMSKKIGAANASFYLLRPAQLMPKLQSSITMLTSLAGSGSGKSYNRLILEISKLIQSTELMALASTIDKEGMDSEMLLIQAPPAGSAAQ